MAQLVGTATVGEAGGGSKRRRRRIRIAIVVGIALNAIVIVVAFTLAWRVASRRTTSAGDLAAEAQTLFGAFGLITASVLVWITGFYAYRTSALARDTKLLAEETRALAIETRRAVDTEVQQTEAMRQQTAAVQQQARAAEHALAATVRPVIVDLAGRDASEPEQSYRFDHGLNVVLGSGVVYVGQSTTFGIDVSVPFRNVGVGTALITSGGINANDPTVGWNVHYNRTVIAPGEYGRVVTTVPMDRPELSALVEALADGGSVVVAVGYTDLLGNRQPLTQFHLWKHDIGWVVRQVMTGPLGDPIAASGPVDSPPSPLLTGIWAPDDDDDDDWP